MSRRSRRPTPRSGQRDMTTETNPFVTVDMTLVALLRGDTLAPELEPTVETGPPLAGAIWAAFQEIEELFRPGGHQTNLHIPIHDSPTATEAVVRPEFSRSFIGARTVQAPTGVRAARGSDEVLQRLVADQTPSPSMSWGSSSYAEWQSSRSDTSVASLRTVPARVLGTLVQEYVQPAGWTLVATDIELQGADGGYLIWDGFPQGSVVSMAALDPRYWREPVESEAQRLRAIKVRARSACISVIGSLLGLQRCTNRSCFMCVDVDTLPEIDEMRIIGDEHACPELGNRAFRPNDDPLAIESIEPAAGASG